MLRSTRVIGKPGSSHAAQKKAGSGRPCSQTRIQARSDRRPGDQNRAAVQQARYTGQALPEPRRGANSVCRVDLVQLRHLADGMSASALQLLQCAADRHHVIELYQAKFAVMHRAPSSRRQRVLKQRKFLIGLEAAENPQDCQESSPQEALRKEALGWAAFERAPEPSAEACKALKARSWTGVHPKPSTPKPLNPKPSVAILAQGAILAQARKSNKAKPCLLPLCRSPVSSSLGDGCGGD